MNLLNWFLPNRKVNPLGEDPIIGGVPPGQGSYFPAPYNHPWTGNLVRVPAGNLNPVDNPFSSFKLGFFHHGVKSTTFQVYSPQPYALGYGQMQAQFNGFNLANQGQLLQGLAQFVSETQDASMGG